MAQNKISRRSFLRGAGASATIAAASCMAPSAAACDIKSLWSMDLQILATSDTHGKFDPWDYAANKADASGSVAQQATAIKQCRTRNTLVVDAGDTIQANSAELFLNDDLHPMIAAMNAIGYDIWTTGNHEYNYGMDVLKKVMGQQKAKVLTGNVYAPDGTPLADGYTIIKKGTVKIGVIGMVTPNIIRWDAKNLEGWKVTNPVDESRRIIDKIKDQVDVLIGVMHMDTENEYGVYGSGVTDLANACPEFDVIVGGHGHRSIPNMMINNVLVVENKNAGATLSEIHVYLERQLDGKWKVVNRTSENLQIKEYEPDPELTALLASYDTRAKEDAVTPIGELKGGDLAPENEIDCLPQAMVQDTALLDFINEVQMYYTGAQVSATALTSMTSQMRAGTIRKCDMASIYTYQNTLYKLQMTGEQLRRFMEWSAAFFKTWKPDEVTIAFDPSVRYYLYDAFEGVNYELDVSKEPGHRIKNLKWPNGKAVKDTDTFVVAVNNYRATTQLLTYADIFKEGDELPKLLEIDVRGDVLGFGGRIISKDDPGAKYMNTPETIVYSKRRVLYGLNLAKKSKRSNIILVEGNIDVVMLHQAGFDNACASMGTALTTEQLQLLSRYTKEIVLCYDNDDAGKVATQKALTLLNNTDFQVKVLELPKRLVDGEYIKQDADDFIKFQGKDAFEHLLSGSESGMDFRMAQLKSKFDLKSDEGRIGFAEAAAGLLSTVPNAVEREIYTVRASEAAGITPDAMKLEVERARKRARYKERREQERRDLNPAASAQPRERSIRYTDLRSALAEEGVLRLLTLDDSLFGENPPIREEDFSSPLLGRFFTALRAAARERAGEHPSAGGIFHVGGDQPLDRYPAKAGVAQKRRAGAQRLLHYHFRRSSQTRSRQRRSPDGRDGKE